MPRIVSEGYLPFGTERTRYRAFGRFGGERTTILALHGGPGGALESLEPLERLADRRPIVFYDQLGGGRSSGCLPLEAWSLGLLVAQLDSVRRALDLRRIHLLGHSFGGALSLEYLLGRPDGIASVVLVSPIASYPIFYAEFSRLVRALPDDDVRALRDLPKDDPGYKRAWRHFQRRHYLRRDVLPDWYPRTYSMLARQGIPREWDATERLDEIDAPVLALSGRHDVVTPEHVELLADRLPRCRHVLLEESSHFAFAEEPEPFFAAVEAFLDEQERPAA